MQRHFPNPMNQKSLCTKGTVDLATLTADFIAFNNKILKTLFLLMPDFNEGQIKLVMLLSWQPKDTSHRLFSQTARFPNLLENSNVEDDMMILHSFLPDNLTLFKFRFRMPAYQIKWPKA